MINAILVLADTLTQIDTVEVPEDNNGYPPVVIKYKDRYFQGPQWIQGYTSDPTYIEVKVYEIH